MRFKNEFVPGEFQPLPSTQDANDGRKALRISPIEERDHIYIVKQYMKDYARYLTSLGFTKVFYVFYILCNKSTFWSSFYLFKYPPSSDIKDS